MPEWRWGVFIAGLDPALGSEQAGTRPVVIVSDEGYNRAMALVTVVPVTSLKPGRRIYSNEVLLERGAAGLSVDSIALAHHLRTIAKARLLERLGGIDDAARQREILEAISKHLGMWWIDLRPWGSPASTGV